MAHVPLVKALRYLAYPCCLRSRLHMEVFGLSPAFHVSVPLLVSSSEWPACSLGPPSRKLPPSRSRATQHLLLRPVPWRVASRLLSPSPSRRSPLRPCAVVYVRPCSCAHSVGSYASSLAELSQRPIQTVQALQDQHIKKTVGEGPAGRIAALAMTTPESTSA